MATAPKIPDEQSSAGDKGDAAGDRPDRAAGARSGQQGDADVNLEEQGRFGNLNQNLTAIRNVQDR